MLFQRDAIHQRVLILLQLRSDMTCALGEITVPIARVAQCARGSRVTSPSSLLSSDTSHCQHPHIESTNSRIGRSLSRGPIAHKGGSIFLELSVTVHPRGCIAAANDMTTIWRPHWLIKHIEPVKEEVPDDDVPDVKVEPVADDDGINGEDGTTPSEGKGAKRKRAPPTKGPCEHGVK